MPATGSRREAQLELAGSTIDELWASLCSQTILGTPEVENLDARIIRHTEIARLESEVDKLTRDHQRVKNPAQRNEIYAKLHKAKAQLEKARAQAVKAKRDLDRIRPLYEQNAASQLDLDNATAAYESAAADVVVCEADLTQAEMTLSYTTVQSPVSGYISERNVDIGTLVGPSGKSLLATVVKSDTVRVDFSMTALDYLHSRARNVNLGQKDTTRKWNPYITVTLDDGSVYPYRGLVDFADPQVDPKTGTFSVRAEMANPDRILLPGQFAKVKLLLDVREDAVVVPSKALVIEKGGAYIYVVRPDSVVEKRFVETGPEIAGNNVVIERGLSSTEHIVVEGYHKLSHGMKVEPVAAVRKEEQPANTEE